MELGDDSFVWRYKYYIAIIVVAADDSVIWAYLSGKWVEYNI